MPRDNEIDLSDLDRDDGATTEQLEDFREGARRVRRFHLAGVEGAFAGRSWTSGTDTCSIGAHESNDLRIDDPAVSRFHCEITVRPHGVRLRDLDSRNGTVVDGMRVADVWLRQGSLIRLGRTGLRFELENEANRLAVSPSTEFGSLVGASVAMRATFSLLERAAGTDSTVLIEGETGTGKEGAAESIHRASARRNGPFVVVDCGAIPANLLESELFGHERGAFTGASARRVGVFEEATGGTVFLDEIGELAPDLQPKLLRVLERREIRRIGGNATISTDVRLIAATNRDLRAEVNAARFRSDLYFRLAVLRITLPPLRQHPEDLPLLVERIVEALGHGRERARALLTPALVAELRRSAWPGNVRELRNFIERRLVFEDEPHPASGPATPAADVAVDPSMPYAEARRVAIETFERSYVRALIAHHGDNVGQAASASGMNRAYLYRLLQRHGLGR